MERYQPTTKEERVHPTLGNLYIARNIQDVVNSVGWIREEYTGALTRLEQRGQAILALRDRIFHRWGEFIPVYIYVPKVEHDREGGRSHSIMVSEGAGELRVFIKGDDRLRLAALKDSWCSDIVLFNILSDNISIYQMSHFLGGHVADRRFLASRILQQEST